MPGAASAENYGLRCRTLRTSGALDDALEAVREGLLLYPGSSQLHAELGCVRLAREEYAWSKDAFQRSLSLDPGNEAAMAGLGKVLLRFGEFDAALSLFSQVELLAELHGPEPLVSMAASLYQEGLYEECRQLLERGCERFQDHSGLLEALGYALLRLGEPREAARCLSRALEIDPSSSTARVNLAHIVYDRGDREGALSEFTKVPAAAHRDAVAVWRVIQTLRAMQGPLPDFESLQGWQDRLDELLEPASSVDRLFAEVGSIRDMMGRYLDPAQLDLFIERRRGTDQPGRRRSPSRERDQN